MKRKLFKDHKLTILIYHKIIVITKWTKIWKKYKNNKRVKICLHSITQNKIIIINKV